MSWSPRWKPYVPVARRRAKAANFAAKLAKKEDRSLSPVQIEGRKIAASFWGAAWCDHLESYSDFENRLPRGRTYVRNGSVIDLQILNGTVKAFVSGSEVYHVSVEINTLGRRSWKRIKDECSESIGSLIDLLQGRFDTAIMERLIDRETGLFPKPKEIKITCSCPDWAGLCKHAAAALYGVGARLDASPELLFTLRGVDHLELISQATEAGNVSRALRAPETSRSAMPTWANFLESTSISPRPSRPSDAAAPSRRNGRAKSPNLRRANRRWAPTPSPAVRAVSNRPAVRRSPLIPSLGRRHNRSSSGPRRAPPRRKPTRPWRSSAVSENERTTYRTGTPLPTPPP